MGKLPVELLGEVVSHLDRSSLLVFVRVSSEFWELGAPILYRKVTVNGRELRRMFLRAGGRPLRRREEFVPPALDGEADEPLGRRTRAHKRRCRRALALAGSVSPRFRRALQWIEDLELRAPMQAGVVQMIWDVAAAGGCQVPLFPGVKSLRIDSAISLPNPPCPPPEDEILVFNRPNVCRFDNFNVFRELRCFPAREYRVVCHDAMGNGPIFYIAKYGVPDSCNRFRVFGAFLAHFVSNLTVQAHRIAGAEEQLRKHPHASLEIHMLPYNIGSLYPGSLERMYGTLEEKGWTPSPGARVQIYIADDPQVPPCAVCGELCAPVVLHADEQERRMRCGWSSLGFHDHYHLASAGTTMALYLVMWATSWTARPVGSYLWLYKP